MKKRNQSLWNLSINSPRRIGCFPRNGPINTAFCKVIHTLEKKVQEFVIYKTTYPDDTPRDPKISDKTDLEISM